MSEGSGQTSGIDRLAAAGLDDGDLEARHILAQVRRRLAGVDDASAEIGRYHLRERIGAGGMGIVYSGYDPQLSRAVALKVLHAGNERAQQRLVREAQALARLSHPNVIEVYDVLTEGETVCLAMELLAGVDLAQWLATPRAVGEVIEVFGAAARGLHAAHSAGLVHRDFKPSNVMLPLDGRVRVLDFGLARVTQPPNYREAADREAADRDAADHEAAMADDAVDRAITRTGAVLGTPAYMAPEQLAGQVADARADQFSFCVALIEALTSTRPFATDARVDFDEQLRIGLPPRPPKRSIPAHVWRAARVGLAADPAQRHPTMEVLVDALRPSSRSRAAWVVGLATVGAVAAAIVANPWSSATPTVCQIEDATHSWNDATRQRMRDAFERATTPSAAADGQRVELTLGRWHQQWSSARQSACANPAGPATALVACLGRERSHVAALIDTLADGDDAVLRGAVKVVAGLSDPARCLDPQTAHALTGPPADPAIAAAVARIRTDVQTAWALERTGQYEDALALARSAHAQSESVGFDPVRAEALRLVATILEQRGDVEAAGTHFTEAHFIAESCGHDDVAMRCIADLIFNMGALRSDTEAAEKWFRLAQARLGRDAVEPYVEATLWLNYGMALYVAGRYDEALARVSGARERIAKHLGPDDFRNASGENAIGTVLLAQQRYKDAIEHQTRALAIQRVALGEEHPLVGDTHSVLAGAYIGLQDYARADTHTQRAVELKRNALGDDSPYYADALINRANVESHQGRHEDSIETLRTALTVYEGMPGDAPLLGTALHNLAIESADVARLDDAERYLRRCIEVRTRSYGAEHWQVATALAELATTLRLRGETEASYEAAEAAVNSLKVGQPPPGTLDAARDVLAKSLQARQVAPASPG